MSQIDVLCAAHSVSLEFPRKLAFFKEAPFRSSAGAETAGRAEFTDVVMASEERQVGILARSPCS